MILPARSSTRTGQRFYVTLPRTLEEQLQVSRSQAPNDIGIPCPLDDEPHLALPRTGIGQTQELGASTVLLLFKIPLVRVFRQGDHTWNVLRRVVQAPRG